MSVTSPLLPPPIPMSSVCLPWIIQIFHTVFDQGAHLLAEFLALHGVVGDVPEEVLQDVTHHGMHPGAVKPLLVAWLQTVRVLHLGLHWLLLLTTENTII